MKRLRLIILSSDSVVKGELLRITVCCSRGRNYARRWSRLNSKSQYIWREKSVSLGTLRKEQSGEFSKNENEHVRSSWVV